MTERDELKLCRKCGPRDVLQSTSRTTTLECMGCNRKVYGSTEREAIAAWNRRAEG